MMNYDDDFNELMSVGEEEASKERAEQRRRSRSVILRNITIFLTIIAVGSGLFFGITRYNDYQREQEKIAEEAARERISLQLVNAEQVEWADNTCAVVNGWTQEDFTVYPDEVEPWVAIGDIVDSLRRNAILMREGAERLSKVPIRSHITAMDRVDNVVLTENFQTIDPEKPDWKTTQASNSLEATLSAYARSMDNMASDMEGLADYDFDGMRSGIILVNDMFSQMNDDLRTDFENIFTTELFDNAATMEAISHLEYCNENMLSQSDVNTAFGDELADQRALRTIMVSERCESFLNNNRNNTNPNEATKKNMESCETYLSTTVIDPDGRIRNKVIEGVDGSLALPDVTGLDEAIVEEPVISESEESTSITDSEVAETSEESENDAPSEPVPSPEGEEQ